MQNFTKYFSQVSQEFHIRTNISKNSVYVVHNNEVTAVFKQSSLEANGQKISHALLNLQAIVSGP